ncbi:hypothetical protein QJR26_12145 [Clostridium baratii]
MNSSSNKVIPFFDYNDKIEKGNLKQISTTQMPYENSNKRNIKGAFSYNNIDKEVFGMDENKILEKYLDKIDKDRREQEERLSRSVELSEKRIYEERIELERRIMEDSKAREERLEKRFLEVMGSIENTNKKIDDTNNKIDEKIDKISEKIDNTNKWITGLCITTIVGIAAIVVTVMIAFLQK